MIDIAKLPRELPAKPEGWRQNMICHLNMGKSHTASFSIHDENGVELPFQRAYRTGKDGFNGFFLYGSDECLTWAQLRQRWPQYRKVCVRLSAAGKYTKADFGPGTAPVPMCVIYDHPKDLPAGFVVRLWDAHPGRVAINRIVAENVATLEEARTHVPAGMVNVGRTDDDDLVIAEVWL